MITVTYNNDIGPRLPSILIDHYWQIKGVTVTMVEISSTSEFRFRWIPTAEDTAKLFKEVRVSEEVWPYVYARVCQIFDLPTQTTQMTGATLNPFGEEGAYIEARGNAGTDLTVTLRRNK